MDRLRVGLWLLAAAPLAWLTAVLVQGFEGFTLALLLMAAGWIAAAATVPHWRRILGALGFGVAPFGVALFYDFVLWDGLPSIAGAVVLVGSLGAAAGCGFASSPALAAGLGVLALGAVLWVISDGAALEWQVGNLLAAVGAGLAGSAAWNRRVD